jgi:hypothetical protein
MAYDLLTKKRTDRDWSIGCHESTSGSDTDRKEISPMATAVAGAAVLGVGLLVQNVGTVLHAPKFERAASTLCILGGGALGAYGVYKDLTSKK